MNWPVSCQGSPFAICMVILSLTAENALAFSEATSVPEASVIDIFFGMPSSCPFTL